MDIVRVKEEEEFEGEDEDWGRAARVLEGVEGDRMSWMIEGSK
jgi:hypothetical protein